jgi:hypothetical protein
MLPIIDEQLAAHLGLDELRVGAGRVGADVGPQVLAWWTVSVEPSFAHSCVVGAVYEEEWTGGPGPDRVAIRGFVADRDGAAISPLVADEVLDALGRLNPFRATPTPRQKVVMIGMGRAEQMWVGTASRDGLGYTVRWGTRAAEGHFRFSNPRAVWLEEFEHVVFRFAQRVVATSGASRFESPLGCWADYREPLKQVEPLSGLDRLTENNDSGPGAD